MKKITGCLLAWMCLLLLAACGREDAEETDRMKVYYVSNSETKVEMHEVEMQAGLYALNLHSDCRDSLG